MNGPTLEGLVRRLERVERAHRRWKWAGAMALAGIAALVLIGQATPGTITKIVEAEKFILRDANGRNRGEWTVIAGGSVLSLIDEDGKGGAALSVVPDGPRRLELWHKDGPSAELVVRPDADSGLRLSDKNGMYRASLDVQADGGPILRLADKNSKTRIGLVVASNDTPSLSFYDRDKDRAFIAGLGVAEDGSVLLALNDREEQSHAELTIPRGGFPSLRFIDKEGKVIWSTP